jgi:hypothetical protein
MHPYGTMPPPPRLVSISWECYWGVVTCMCCLRASSFSFYYYPSLVRVDTPFSPTFSPPDSQGSLVKLSILCHLEPLSFRCRLFDSHFHVHTFGLRPQHSNSIPGVDTYRTNIPSINGVSKPLLHISYFQDPHLGRKDPIGKRLNGS